ncbi:hypothetical protein [Leptospira sarikeiensis]|nr:hypothetical protein [Leptospira sarikeiensis]
MKNIFRPEHLNDLAARMEIRANHIYILFISLLNIIGFTVDIQTQSSWLSRIDKGSRLLLIASGILSLFAFVIEHSGTLQNRSLTFYSVVTSLAGVVLLTFSYILSARINRTV